jgi:hypothetical protein
VFVPDKRWNLKLLTVSLSRNAHLAHLVCGIFYRKPFTTRFFPEIPQMTSGSVEICAVGPSVASLARFNARTSDHESYLPYVVGDGKDGIFRICRASGMSSLLRPNKHMGASKNSSCR